MQHATTTLTRLALVALLALNGCALFKPGGIDTEQGQRDLADLLDITQLTCTEAGRAAGDDSVKVEAALSLLRRAVTETATLEAIQADMQQIGLKAAWVSRLSTLYSILSRRLKQYLDTQGDAVQIADAVVASCRAGFGAANLAGTRTGHTAS